MRSTIILLAVALFFGAIRAADDAVVAPVSSSERAPAQPRTVFSDAITIPRMLSYQGKLTDSLGVPVPDGNYQLTFRLYTQQTGGTPFWTEAQTVAVRNGLFSVLLGAVNPLPSVPDAGALYLSLQVGITPELSPRLQIVSSAYAYLTERAANADLLQGKDTVALSARFVDEGQANAVTGAMIVDGTIQSADIASNAVTSAKIGNGEVTMAKINQSGATAGQVIKWTGSAWAPQNDSAGGPPSGPAGGDLTGTYPNPTIASNAVTSAKIQDGTIRGADIAKPCTLTASVATNAVLRIKNTGINGYGIIIDSAVHDGLYVSRAGDDGINVFRANGDGLAVDSAGYDGVWVQRAGANGVRIYRANVHGLYVDSAGYDGVSVYRAGWNGFRVDHAGGYGLSVDSAGYSGVYVARPGGAGIHVYCAGSYGLYVDSANLYGVLASGNTAGGSFIADNSSAEGLRVHAYYSSSSDTAIQVYGRGYATGGWYTGGLLGDKEAPCLISPELGIIASGTGKLVNGTARITLPQLMVENLRKDVPVRITVTPRGKPAGLLYVTQQGEGFFKVEMEVIAGLSGERDVVFDWIAFGTMREYETSARAKAEWEKMIEEREEMRQEAEREAQRRRQDDNRWIRPVMTGDER